MTHCIWYHKKSDFYHAFSISILKIYDRSSKYVYLSIKICRNQFSIKNILIDYKILIHYLKN